MNKIIIIGNSAAGLSALESFRKYDKTSEVTIISKEGTTPYSRVLLPYILREKIPYRCLELRSEDYFRDLNARCVMDEVVRIDTQDKTVYTSSQVYTYDKLFIATGSYAVAPPIQGIRSEGIFHMWTKSDLDQLIPYFEKSKRVCVMGSGFVALQAAWAARCRGMQVTVVELMNRIMPNVLDEHGAGILSRNIQKKGVDLLTGANTKSFERLSDGSFKVHVEGKKDIPADFIIVGTGVRPNIRFLEGSGIQTDRGILVDSHMMTNIQDVYAGGDVAAGPTIFGEEHFIHALWPTAGEMGQIAGENMAGVKREYEGSLNMNVTEMYGVTVASMGRFNDEEIDESYVFNEDEGYGYLKICYSKGLLIGACLVGSSDAVKIFGKLRPLIRRKEKVNCDAKGIYDYLNKETFKKVVLGEAI